MYDVSIVLENLKIISISFGFFLLLWLSNFVLSLYYNIGIVKDSFDKTKLKDGFLKMISVMVGTLLLIVAFTTLPQFLTYIGFPQTEEIQNLFNVIGISGIIITSSITYGKQAIQTLTDIFKIK